MTSCRPPAALIASLLMVLLIPALASPASAMVVVEILSPGPGNVTDEPTFLVTGTVTPGSSLAVNG